MAYSCQLQAIVSSEGTNSNSNSLGYNCVVWSKSSSDSRNLNLFLAPKLLYDTCTLCILVSGLKLAPTSFPGITGKDEGYRVEALFLVNSSVPRTELHKCIFFRIFRTSSKSHKGIYVSFFLFPSLPVPIWGTVSTGKGDPDLNREKLRSSMLTYYLCARLTPHLCSQNPGTHLEKKQNCFSLERINRKRMWKVSWLY